SLSWTGCRPASTAAVTSEPTPVTVSHPLTRSVRDFADFTSRTAAVDSVEVRARVTGYLDKVNFKEGTLVKKGDVLFEIDPRSYQDAFAQAEGNLAAAQAKFTRLDAELKRMQVLLSSRSASREEYEKVAGDRNEAAASL